MQEKLIGKQFRRWEIDRRLRRRFERDEQACRMAASAITISRQWGSGGTSIAKLVAKQLDLKLYDREIIDHVAELAGVRPDQVEEHDERGPNVVSSLVLQLLEGKRPTESSYLRALVKVIREIAAEGDAVIVGRGANFILPAAFNARIIAPEPLRIARIGELHNVDEKTARRMVIESDRQRTRFVRWHLGADPDDALAYDLVINTEHYSIQRAATLVITGVAERKEALEAECKLASS